MKFDPEICIKKSLKLTDVEKKNRSFCDAKKQIGFQWNLFGTPGTIPHSSPILLLFNNFVRPEMSSRGPCRSKKRLSFRFSWFSFNEKYWKISQITIKLKKKNCFRKCQIFMGFEPKFQWIFPLPTDVLFEALSFKGYSWTVLLGILIGMFNWNQNI